MKDFFQSVRIFFNNISHDSRIPDFDKKLIIGLLVFIFLPIRFVFSWFAAFEPIVDFLLIAFISDYFFEILDPSIVLSHYPWSMKSFARLQRVGHFFAFFAIDFIKSKLWRYKRDPF